MTPAELRDIVGSVKPASDAEARSRAYLVGVLNAHGDNGRAAATELAAAVEALHWMAEILRGVPTGDQGSTT